MGVNGGAGNEIKFSDLQTFYGGSNPIAISEYYRGGSEVPGLSTVVPAQSNTSGSSTQTIGQFTATVSSAFNGGLSGFSDTVSFGQTISVTVGNNTAVVGIATAHPDKDGGNSTINYTVNVGGSSVSVSSNDGSGNGAFIEDGYWQGPAANGATTGGPSRGTVSSGTTLSLTKNRVRFRVKTRSQTFDVVFRNNNANTLTTTSGSSGGAQTYTQNQSRTVRNNQGSGSYTLGYNAVTSDGNTNVPDSGQINLDVFNNPGNPTP